MLLLVVYVTSLYNSGSTIIHFQDDNSNDNDVDVPSTLEIPTSITFEQAMGDILKSLMILVYLHSEKVGIDQN